VRPLSGELLPGQLPQLQLAGCVCQRNGEKVNACWLGKAGGRLNPSFKKSSSCRRSEPRALGGRRLGSGITSFRLLAYTDWERLAG
jgi:hypothetical protein